MISASVAPLALHHRDGFGLLVAALARAPLSLSAFRGFGCFLARGRVGALLGLGALFFWRAPFFEAGFAHDRFINPFRWTARQIFNDCRREWTSGSRAGEMAAFLGEVDAVVFDLGDGVSMLT